MKALAAVLASLALFAFGVAASARKQPCPGNSCHGKTTTTVATTTAPTTTSTTTSSTGWTVPPSISSDCSVDTAAQISSWLATVPDGETARFSGGCYRIEAVVEIDQRRLTIDGGGATFRSYNAPEDQRPFFRAAGSTLTFKNMTLYGSYAAAGTLTDSLQHAHGFDLRGTAATISNVTIRNVAGDCAYFGLGYDNTTRSSGAFTDSTCDGTGRNGVSVTAGDNVTVSGSRFSRIGYDGVDVEPNQAAGNWGATNVAVTGNSFATVALNALSVVETGPEAKITLSGNTSPGAMKIAVAAVGKTFWRPQGVTIRDNTGASGSVSVEHVDGLAVSGNTGPVYLSDCTGVTA
jgi:hypothetical protein